MNAHNPRKRRLSGHGPTIPPSLVTQGPPTFSSVPTTTPSLSLAGFSDQDLQILSQAASILHCPFEQILELDRNPQRAVPSPSAAYSEPKRQRLSTDTRPMPSQNTSPPCETPRRRRGQTLRDSQEDGFSLGISGSRLAQVFASFTVCPPCSTCEPEGYSGLPATSQFEYSASPPLLSEKSPSSPAQPWVMSGGQAGFYGYDESPAMRHIPGYPVLQPTQQPTTVQPSTSGEGMVYPETTAEDHKYIVPSSPLRRESHGADHVTEASAHYCPPPHREAGESASASCVPDVNFVTPSEGSRQQTREPPGREVGIVHQRPLHAKRGPFKNDEAREGTAETRRIGSCVRCRMQRIRCVINPEDKNGACLTCLKVTNVKIWRLPCLRYKITDVKLFKPGQMKGLEWSLRWPEGIADDISQWASMEVKTVCVTEGYTNKPVRLRVRQFVPQEGDKLDRTWMYNGVQRSVRIPAYAILNTDEAQAAYEEHLNTAMEECCRSVVYSKHRLIQVTYAAALRALASPATNTKEKALLTKALRLWVAIRMTTRSTYIVGQETLGMTPDILDETSPMRGHIPLPPVMGAQIDLILIHKIETELRQKMLEGLQSMVLANDQSTWLTTYLVIFIYLHNVSLLCQHDAGYARKHGIKRRFARENMVKEYMLGEQQPLPSYDGPTVVLTNDATGANILLAYFHYCNKGMHPFSAESKEQDVITQARLDHKMMQFVKFTKSAVQEKGNLWDKVRRGDDYEDDGEETTVRYCVRRRRRDG